LVSSRVAAPGRAVEGVVQLVSLDGIATICIQTDQKPSNLEEFYSSQKVSAVGNGCTVNSRETGELCTMVEDLEVV
jgi:hypothetical protein